MLSKQKSSGFSSKVGITSLVLACIGIALAFASFKFSMRPVNGPAPSNTEVLIVLILFATTSICLFTGLVIGIVALAKSADENAQGYAMAAVFMNFVVSCAFAYCVVMACGGATVRM